MSRRTQAVAFALFLVTYGCGSGAVQTDATALPPFSLTAPVSTPCPNTAPAGAACGHVVVRTSTDDTASVSYVLLASEGESGDTQGGVVVWRPGGPAVDGASLLARGVAPEGWELLQRSHLLAVGLPRDEEGLPAVRCGELAQDDFWRAVGGGRPDWAPAADLAQACSDDPWSSWTSDDEVRLAASIAHASEEPITAWYANSFASRDNLAVLPDETRDDVALVLDSPASLSSSGLEFVNEQVIAIDRRLRAVTAECASCSADFEPEGRWRLGLLALLRDTTFEDSELAHLLDLAHAEQQPPPSVNAASAQLTRSFGDSKHDRANLAYLAQLCPMFSWPAPSEFDRLWSDALWAGRTVLAVHAPCLYWPSATSFATSEPGSEVTPRLLLQRTHDPVAPVHAYQQNGVARVLLDGQGHAAVLGDLPECAHSWIQDRIEGQAGATNDCEGLVGIRLERGGS